MNGVFQHVVDTDFPQLFIDVANCFRCRTLQFWGAKPPSVASKQAIANSELSNQSLNSINAHSVHGSFQVLNHQQEHRRAVLSPSTAGDVGLDIDGDETDNNFDSGVHKLVLSASHEMLEEQQDNSVDIEFKESFVETSSDYYTRQSAEKKLNSGLNGGSKSTTLYSKTTEVIEPQAYYVPCPVTSGGFFTSCGKLVLFGGAKLYSTDNGLMETGTLSIITDDKVLDELSHQHEREAPNTKSIWVKNTYPKSYADMLLRLREREFYLSENIENKNEKGENKQSNKRNKKKRDHVVKSSSGVFFIEADNRAGTRLALDMNTT